MLSRAAESIYWMGRYIERVENIARFIDVNLNLMLDMPGQTHNQWEPLVSVTGDHEWFYEKYGNALQDNVIHFLTFDKEYPNSILSSLNMARENARSIREIISTEMWERINKFYLSMRDTSESRLGFSNMYDFYDHIRSNCNLIAGTTDATMSHNEGWHFARMGSLIERADKTSRIVDIKYFILLPSITSVGTPYDTIQWAALLKSVGGLEMYRRQYGRIVPEKVAQFLVLDNLFPRAMRYCLIKAEESLHAITHCPMGAFSNEPEKYMGRLRADLDYATMKEILSVGMHEYIDDFQLKLNNVSVEISKHFFDMTYDSDAMFIAV